MLNIVEAGHILACLSGLLVHRIGGASYLGVGKLGEAIITFTSPFVMDINVNLFIGHRFALGIFEVIPSNAIKYYNFRISNLTFFVTYFLCDRDYPLWAQPMSRHVGYRRSNECG